MLPVNTSTKLCAIIGNPVGHSMSPAIHNAAFKELGLNYVYLAFKIETSSVADILTAMRHMDNFVGLSVTIPHKMEVVKYVDDISDADKNTGSINTVIKQKNRLIGMGSDGPGARKALLDKNIDPKGKNIAILGNGGAARALAFDLAFNSTPAKITIIGRNIDKVSALADDIKNRTSCIVDVATTADDQIESVLKESSILINTTSVGMHPNTKETLINPDFMHKNLCIMDIVYNPLETLLLNDARNMGLQTISGLDMFVNQAALQFEAWTGHPAPVNTMRKITLKQLSL